MALVLHLSNTLYRVDKRLKQTEAVLHAISRQVGVPEHPLNEELRRLVKDGEKIEAIKKSAKREGFIAAVRKRVY